MHCLFFAVEKKQLTEAQIREAFETADKDNDNKITADELSAYSKKSKIEGRSKVDFEVTKIEAEKFIETFALNGHEDYLDVLGIITYFYLLSI